MGGRGSASASSRTQASHASETFGIDTGEYDGFMDKYQPSYLRKAAVAFTARNLSVTDEVARELNSAVNDYSDRSYSIVREYQRGQKTRNDQKAADVSKKLETYIEKAPKWGGSATYRGVSSATVPKVGDVIDMGGTSSWTTKSGIAASFASTAKESGLGGNAIVFKSGTQKKGTSIRHLSHSPHEDEVVVSRKSRYMVSSVSLVDGVYQVGLKEVRK